MEINKYKVSYSLGVFFLIFAFPLLPGLSSAKFIILIVALLFLLHKDFAHQVYKACHAFGKEFLYSFLLMFIITLALPILWQSFEWTMVTRFISAFFLYFVSYFYYQRAQKYIKIDNVIFYCFLIQSILIILAICSQTIYDATAHFRNISENHVEAYGRLRGNAVCGYQFFGIVLMYAFMIVYYILHTNSFKAKWYNILIILIAAICSGRSVVLSIFIAILFYLIKLITIGQLRKALLIISITVSLSVGSSLLLLNNYRKISDPVMLFAVENYFVKPLESITSDSGFESNSTDELENMYNKNEIKKYFIWGSGRFENADGSYFGHVDIGYYRILGYYGIAGGVGAFILTISLFFCSRSKLDSLTKIAFFTLVLLYNFKGEVALWSNNIIPILVGYLFFSNTKKTDISYNDNYRHITKTSSKSIS